MTKRFEKALEQATSLPDSEQAFVAQIMLDGMESERKWNELFARTSPELRKLADAAWAEHEAGLTERLDPEKM